MDPVSGDFADDSILALLACRVVPLLKLSSGQQSLPGVAHASTPSASWIGCRSTDVKIHCTTRRYKSESVSDSAALASVRFLAR